jgi:hypothetical protein
VARASHRIFLVFDAKKVGVMVGERFMNSLSLSQTNLIEYIATQENIGTLGEPVTQPVPFLNNL